MRSCRATNCRSRRDCNSSPKRDISASRILGFSFKAGTDDLPRESDDQVIERLIGKGYDVRIYDNERESRELGWRESRFYSQPHSAHFAADGRSHRCGARSRPDNRDRDKDPEFQSVFDRLREGQRLVDFVRITGHRSENGKYDGICW